MIRTPRAWSEYFTRVQELVKGRTSNGDDQDAQAETVLEQIPFAGFCRPTRVQNVDLMPAGCLDATYQSRLAELDWHLIYETLPAIFRSFARRLARDYEVVLVDSRTGMTDISGICTSLLPDKLVVVFTAKPAELGGDRASGSIQRRVSAGFAGRTAFARVPAAVENRCGTELRQLWRHGDSVHRIEGFQPQFERIFCAAYAMDSCDLSSYCSEVQVQHSPDYSYGEEVAALDATEADRFSIVRSYQALLRWLQTSAAPWESPESAQARKRLESLLNEEAEALKEDPPKDLRRLARLQEEIVEIARQQRGPLHLDAIAAMERLIEQTFARAVTSREASIC